MRRSMPVRKVMRLRVWLAAATVGTTAASMTTAGSDLDTILSRLYATSMADHDQSSICTSAQKLVTV